LITIKFPTVPDVVAIRLRHHTAGNKGWQAMEDRYTTALEIAEMNIEHYSRLLKTSLDGPARTTIEKLLAEEKAKLATLSAARLKK
jgi:hypothetical protein